ncbi:MULTISPECIES: sigma-70 family RNA polymerase sigma factor [unclassified Iodidimonas]|uniref:sigma-70 family RNA polymerase sigma factor n=1 Tax=Iodidimonas sp. MBR-22 TaxID=3032320 RepID=UPI0024824100|nr:MULTISPECIES: sigma-70 family RNA polymerase sigma factor [unclassified Iodidimonas]
MADLNKGGRAMKHAILEQIKHEIPHLRRYARSLTRDLDQADDLLQDSLERAISRQDFFREGSNLRSWMFTIMHNMHIDQCRSLRRRGVHIPMEEWGEGMSHPAPQPWTVELEEFSRSFDRLSEPEQSVVLLVGVCGYKYHEAADHLGLAVGTVKSRLFRARDSLRDMQKSVSVH